MGINHYHNKKLGQKAKNISQDIKAISRRSGESISFESSEYTAPEVNVINQAMKQCQQELSHIASQIELLGDKIIQATNEIKAREDREREAMMEHATYR